MMETVNLIAAALGVIAYLILFALLVNDKDFPAREPDHEDTERESHGN